MFKTIILKGHYRWIVPLAIVLVTIYLTSCYNKIESFEMENTLKKMMGKVKKIKNKEANELKNEKKDLLGEKTPEEVLEDIEKDITEDKKEIKKVKDKTEIKKDITEDKKDINKVLNLTETLEKEVEKLKKELKNDDKADEDIKLLKGLEEEIKKIKEKSIKKENFANFSNVDGYNLSNYESIFPKRKVNKFSTIKHKTKPDILGYECDINNKILQYESTNVFQKYHPEKQIDRPKFMYHRHDGNISPYITDENRFDISQFNVFRHT
jgi:hypothetical protein